VTVTGLMSLCSENDPTQRRTMQVPVHRTRAPATYLEQRMRKFEHA
jgi:hypothetical protein